MVQKMGIKVQFPVGSGLSQEEVVEEENVSEARGHFKAPMLCFPNGAIFDATQNVWSSYS